MAPPTSGTWHDLFATMTELTVQAVARAYRRVRGAGHARSAELVASGGGARNRELMRRLARRWRRMPVVTSDRYGLPADFKEAIAFALLASARLDRDPGATCPRSPAPAALCCWAR